jgi:hypothetical protein
LFLFVDHFEPSWRNATRIQEQTRLSAWLNRYPRIAGSFRDAGGRPPQHTWFYPIDEYRPEHLQALSELCFKGYGEVELHLHHDGDTPDNLRATLRRALREYAQYGALLTAEAEPRSLYGFIHGMFALDNSRSDGRYCGVNNELQILRETGCYADFTLPTPDETQPRLVNRIYYATDHPNRPKSHDAGVEAAVGRSPSGDLLLLPGPLGFNPLPGLYQVPEQGRPPRFLSAVEEASITRANLPTPPRIDLWVWTGIHVAGRPEWVFVKVHTHGAQDHDLDALLGPPIQAMHAYLSMHYNDGERYVLHYVTAREAYNLVKAAEAGCTGDPEQYRDYLIPPYANRRVWASGPYHLETCTANQIVVRPRESAAGVEFKFRDHPLDSVRGVRESLEVRREGRRVILTTRGPGTLDFTLAPGWPAAVMDGASLRPSARPGLTYSALPTAQEERTITIGLASPAVEVAPEPDHRDAVAA